MSLQYMVIVVGFIHGLLSDLLSPTEWVCKFCRIQLQAIGFQRQDFHELHQTSLISMHSVCDMYVYVVLLDNIQEIVFPPVMS
ncbi:hypothetical protein CRYUN_Cryun08bG0055400 [Craigia yunnanensis]